MLELGIILIFTLFYRALIEYFGIEMVLSLIGGTLFYKLSKIIDNQNNE